MSLPYPQWAEVLRPAPLSTYRSIVGHFFTSFSFPLFVAYVAMTSSVKWWKRNTRPVEGAAIKLVLVVYNFVISAVNVYCTFGFVFSLWESGSLYARDPNPYLKRALYIYWATKVVELSDTVFMLLRHKFRQVSPLHVYHHASMLLLSDLAYSKYPYANFAVGLMLNSFVHVVLYAYYGLTAAGYSPPWKKRLTELQIVQFVIDLIHAIPGVLYHNFCVWSMLYGFSMLYLFTDFYIKNYLRKRDSGSEGDKFKKNE